MLIPYSDFFMALLALISRILVCIDAWERNILFASTIFELIATIGGFFILGISVYISHKHFKKFKEMTEAYIIPTVNITSSTIKKKYKENKIVIVCNMLFIMYINILMNFIFLSINLNKVQKLLKKVLVD